jgi:DNA-binding transcriptional ArsR family regulator
MSTVSKHLSLLKDAGIVLSEKRGLQVWCRLRVPCIMSFFSCVDAVFADPDADRVDVPLAAREAPSRKVCSSGCNPSWR